MADRNKLMDKLTEALKLRQNLLERIVPLRSQLINLEGQLNQTESNVNALIAAIYPTTLPQVSTPQEGRVFRDENGENKIQAVPVTPTPVPVVETTAVIPVVKPDPGLTKLLGLDL